MGALIGLGHPEEVRMLEHGLTDRRGHAGRPSACAAFAAVPQHKLSHPVPGKVLAHVWIGRLYSHYHDDLGRPRGEATS